MKTYILIHNPYRPNAAKVPESPAWEIAANIWDNKRPTTAFGGWSITVNEGNIKPDDRLLFYRSGCSGGPAGGYFAVGRVLPASNAECRKLRESGLLKWYEKPGELSEAIGPGLAAYTALNWYKGKKEKTIHVNAEWHAVANPKEKWVLSPLVGPVPRQSGVSCSEEVADIIWAECMKSPIALSSPKG